MIQCYLYYTVGSYVRMLFAIATTFMPLRASRRAAIGTLELAQLIRCCALNGWAIKLIISLLSGSAITAKY